jgi:hypothetical protein
MFRATYSVDQKSKTPPKGDINDTGNMISIRDNLP